jgi:hypothetical protein
LPEKKKPLRIKPGGFFHGWLGMPAESRKPRSAISHHPQATRYETANRASFTSPSATNLLLRVFHGSDPGGMQPWHAACHPISMQATSTFGFSGDSSLGLPYGAQYPSRSIRERRPRRPGAPPASVPTPRFPVLTLKLRLFRRRLTISSPRMSVRSALPWPLRWIGLALMFGFSAAIALWAFEFGKEIAGLDRNAREELAQLRQEVATLRDERDKVQSVANTSGSVLIAEKAAQEKMAAQIKQLEADNRSLRDDLGFFEKLLPAGGEAASIRSLQAEVLSETQLRWQLLVIQAVKDAPMFNGRLDLTVAGSQAGKPWVMHLPGGPQPLQFRQSRRLEGVLDLPPATVVNTVTAKVMEGAAVRSVQTFRL